MSTRASLNLNMSTTICNIAFASKQSAICSQHKIPTLCTTKKTCPNEWEKTESVQLIYLVAMWKPMSERRPDNGSLERFVRHIWDTSEHLNLRINIFAVYATTSYKRLLWTKCAWLYHTKEATNPNRITKLTGAEWRDYDMIVYVACMLNTLLTHSVNTLENNCWCYIALWLLEQFTRYRARTEILVRMDMAGRGVNVSVEMYRGRGSWCWNLGSRAVSHAHCSFGWSKHINDECDRIGSSNWYVT